MKRGDIQISTVVIIILAILVLLVILIIFRESVMGSLSKALSFFRDTLRLANDTISTLPTR